jgi:hypothetical protein
MHNYFTLHCPNQFVVLGNVKCGSISYFGGESISEPQI